MRVNRAICIISKGVQTQTLFLDLGVLPKTLSDLKFLWCIGGTGGEGVARSGRKSIGKGVWEEEEDRAMEEGDRGRVEEY